MTYKINLSLLKSMVKRIVMTLWVAMAVLPSSAFERDFYAENSALANGRWIKVRVESSGLYRIPLANLRSWGFTDPAKVSIHGYGGRRIPDVLSTDNYIDDLPAVASELTDDGIVFYAAGPDRWALSTGRYYHGETSHYTSYGYYFVTQGDTDTPAAPLTGVPDVAGAQPATTAQGRAHHETDRIQASEAGPAFVGEDFRYQSTRRFDFKTPGKVDNAPDSPEKNTVWMECQFVHYHPGATAMLSFAVDGTELPAVSTDKVAATSSSVYVHGSVGLTRHKFDTEKSDGFALDLTYTPTRMATMANLDYISVNYTRNLKLDDDGTAMFWSDSRALQFECEGADVRIWDVTNPEAVERVDAGLNLANQLEWSTSRSGMRAYAAWRPGARLPAPVAVGRVENQNLHADSDSADMIIFSPAAYTAQARRIADIHAKYDGMKVSIVDPEKVYNEFSSGAPDVSGLRKYLKMLLDRGQAPAFALLLGRTTLDHRGILPTTERLAANTVPWWVTDATRLSMSDNDGFGTDDFIALLEDGSGRDIRGDKLLVAVGRIPMLSAEDGDEIIDKLSQYISRSKKTGWKNRLLILADDEDQGVHLSQAEKFVAFASATPGQQHLIDKVYIDAYNKVNGTYPEARNEMMRALEEGVAWMYFTGHANNHSWTADGMLSYTDINNMYLRNVPFVVAATCDFLRWDSETVSGGEIMYKERNGGAIGMISATRPVYISDNEHILAAMGRHTLARDDDGRFLPSGEIYRRAKNDILNGKGQPYSNPNRPLYVFMGDPAMRLSTPDNTVEIVSIDGQAPELDSQITLGALGSPVIKGRINGPDGAQLTGFEGVVNVEIYDALRSVVTHGNGNGREDTFDVHGDKLFAGSAPVHGGEFTITAAMPGMVADNFRPATMSLYAYATNGPDEAIGTNSDFYVFGFDEPEKPDTIPPVIESMALNHAGFNSGDQVNPSPMVIATVSDNVGINLSTAGVGHQMVITLDDKRTFNDVSSFYTPAADGSPSGTINYPLENLTEGSHSLRLRVFDTSGNVASHTVEFNVNPGLAPQIFDVFTDTNPASVETNFYVRHDRPENIVEVSVIVYDLLGHPVWSSTAKGMSDNDLSSPVKWNLCDMAGRRVPRGIYLYRATLTTDMQHYETASRRIAVTAE